MFPSFVRSLSLAALLSVCASQGFAQAREIQPGARIRFSGSEVGTTVTAMVLERHGDTLRVLRGNVAPFDVRVSELKSLRISQGRSRAAGAGVGALWGAGINLFSAIILVAAAADCGDCRTEVDGSAFALYLVSGGFTGGLIGALIGKESWADVSLPSGTSVHAVLRERQVGMALRLTF